MDDSCALCGSRTSQLLGKIPDDRARDWPAHPLHECNCCGHWFLRPVKTPDTAALHLRAYSEGVPAGWERLYVTLRAWIFRSPAFRYWSAYDGDQYFLSVSPPRPNARLLDFGCFEGRLLAQYHRRGYDVEGADSNAAAVRVARETGRCVHVGLPPEGAFDVIVMCGVVEHLTDPTETLQRLRGLLSQTGRLKLSCPNRGSVFRRVFGLSWANWHAPFHRHVFDADTLEGLLGNAGFSVVRLATISPSIDLMRSTLVATGLQSNTRYPRVYLAVPIMLVFAVFLKPLIWFINFSGLGDSLVVEAQPER